MLRPPSRFVAIALLLAAGCATLSAKRAVTAAEKARSQGDFPEAIRRYQEAIQADGGKPEYPEALARVRREAAEDRAQAARQAEARGDYAEAVRLWGAALEYLPGNAELSARRDLAQAKTKRSDPVEYFEASKRLAAALPGDTSVQASLREAQAAALRYHLRLADTYVEAGSWAQAQEEFEVAKRIEPDNEVFRSHKFRQTQAKALEARGDERLREGDALAAYQAFEQAAALISDPGLEAKMRRARRGAGSVLEQLDQARAAEDARQWEEAADLYSLLANRPQAPRDTAERAQRARKESAKLRAERARAYAEKGLIGKATAELTLALEHSDASRDALRLVGGALEDLGAEQVGSAKQKLDQARALAPELAVLAVTPVVEAALAGQLYEKAQAIAEQAPAEALLRLRQLEPYKERLKGFQELRDRLVKKAFTALLEEAEQKAGGEHFAEATERVLTALDFSKPPAELAEKLRRAATALERKEWEQARSAFAEAQQAAPRSQLARVGAKVAGLARLVELRREAEDARAVDDSVRLAQLYRGILALDPEDAQARSGLDAMKGQLVSQAQAAAEQAEAKGQLGVAFVYWRRVLELDPTNYVAKVAAEKLKPGLHGRAEPEAYVAPGERSPAAGEGCPGFEKLLRERLVLYLTKTKGAGAEYLKREDVLAVDDKKLPAPPVVLRTKLVACTADTAGGKAALEVELWLGTESLSRQVLDLAFDPTSLPKDELAEGLSPKRVEKALVGNATKLVEVYVKANAARLGGWRARSSGVAIAQNDGEAAARLYAALVLSPARDPAEEQSLRELERFLANRYR